MKPILCILAGGRSSRFGSQKMWLRVDGKPIASALAQRLGAVCGQRWLSVAPGKELPPGAGRFDRIIADHVGFRGPLPAMAKVLGAAPRGAMVVIAAGDMPRVDPLHVRKMLELLRRRRDLVGVMSRWTSGSDVGLIEPMPSVWRAERGARLIQSAMMRGVKGPQQLAKWKRVMCVAMAGESARHGFGNVNRREDAEGMGIFQ